MKKSSVKKTCSAIIVIIAVSILILVLQARSASISYFEFLEHPKPFVKNIEHKRGTLTTKETQFYYAFETDYNDFYARASLELTKLNFIPGNSLIFSIPEDPTVDKPNSYGSEWSYRDSSGYVSVLIYHNYELSDEEKNLQKLYTGSRYAEECITVHIRQSKKENRLIYMLKLLLYKLRN